MRVIASQADWTSVQQGEVVVCDYESQCSACLQHDNKQVHQAGVVILANITKFADGWHGWWSCSGEGTAKHWERGAILRRWTATGSATP